MCSHLFIFNLWAVNELLIIAYLGQWIHSNWCVFFHGIHYIHPLVWIRKNVPILDALRPGYHRIGRKRLQHHHRWSSQNHAYKSINGVTRVSSRFGVVTYRDSAFRSRNKEEHQKMNSVCVWDASEYKQNIAKWKHNTPQRNEMQSIFRFYLFAFHSIAVSIFEDWVKIQLTELALAFSELFTCTWCNDDTLISWQFTANGPILGTKSNPSFL